MVRQADDIAINITYEMCGRRRLCSRRCVIFGIFIFMSLVWTWIVVKYVVDLLRMTAHFVTVPTAETADVAEIVAPIILWWTGFSGERGAYKPCGSDQCFFTVRRKFKNHPNMTVFMFYGTDLEASDLPLPRQQNHEWGVFHEESPKNNILFNFEDTLILFNYTATFRRESHFPLTTQYLISQPWLMSAQYLKTVHAKNQMQKETGLAPIVYVQSDCDPPSDRDSYIKLLMKHIRIDSYGPCLNNKKLPKHLQDPLAGMGHNDFYALVSQYKFAIAMENAVCPDYITEKLWRPLMLGVVPVVYGSPSVKDMLPSNHSAVVISDFKDVKSLAAYLHKLNHDDGTYVKYLSWKQEGISTSVLQDHLKKRNFGDNNMVSAFECFVCQRTHENLRRKARGLPPVLHIANASHYGCPEPSNFDENGKPEKDSIWKYEWMYSRRKSHFLREFVENRISFTKDKLENLSHFVLDKSF